MHKDRFEKIVSELSRKDNNFKLMVDKLAIIPIVQKTLDFSCLVKIVIGQQLFTRVANIIYSRFLLLFSDISHITPQNLLKIEKQKLREIGISFLKVRYINELARVMINHPELIETWKHLDDENASREIQKLTGFGVWSASIILLFYLGRLDVFPHTDTTIKKAYRKIYKIDFSKDLREVQWAKPYRSVLARYLWSWNDFKTDEVKK